MRVNVYAEEITDQVQVLEKKIDGVTFTGIRFYLHLPVTVEGKQHRGPFEHRPGDDDSSAVTFWSTKSEDLHSLLGRALKTLEERYQSPA